MKSCPSCQQVYPDDSPDFCAKDGTPLVRSSTQYNPGPPPGDQWQQPPSWQAPPPLSYGYAPTAHNESASTEGAGRLATIAMLMGIIAVATLVLGFVLSASASSSYYGPNIGLVKFVSILFMLMFITGLTAINVGIVAVSMASQNPTHKAKSIVGLCLGAVPFLLLIIIFMASGPRFRF